METVEVVKNVVLTDVGILVDLCKMVIILVISGHMFQQKPIHGQLWHRYSLTVSQVMVLFEIGKKRYDSYYVVNREINDMIIGWI